MITKLNTIISVIKTFTDADQCIAFLKQMKDRNIFLITSGTLVKSVMPTIHDVPQIKVVFIFCGSKSYHEQWAKDWSKISNIVTDFSDLCTAVQLAVQQWDKEPIKSDHSPTSSIKTTKDLDLLPPSFMYTQVLMEIFLEINFDDQHVKAFVNYAREFYEGNKRELGILDELESNYRKFTPIWWYTRDSCLYRLLSRAMRVMDVRIIMKLGFFICGLHRQIEQLHLEQFTDHHHHSHKFVVDRGQYMNKADFLKLRGSLGGLLSFNGLLSTAFDPQIAEIFAGELTDNDTGSVVFEIVVDTLHCSTPFANVCHWSAFPEDEVFLSFNSVFRIDRIEESNNNNKSQWVVYLTSVSDFDQQIHSLMQHIREETQGSTGWHRLGKFLLKLGEFDEAEDLRKTNQ